MKLILVMNLNLVFVKENNSLCSKSKEISIQQYFLVTIMYPNQSELWFESIKIVLEHFNDLSRLFRSKKYLCNYWEDLCIII